MSRKGARQRHSITANELAMTLGKPGGYFSCFIPL